MERSSLGCKGMSNICSIDFRISRLVANIFSSVSKGMRNRFYAKY
jgi:hypothetical protein